MRGTERGVDMEQHEKRMRGDPNTLATEMRTLINDKETSDVKFIIGPDRKPVYAHRCVLAARCDVFRSMFTSDKPADNTDGPLVLADVTTDVFAPMLEFIYTNCVTLTRQTAADVLGASVEYGLDGLRQLCADYLSTSVSVQTACETMQVAVTYGQDELRQKAIAYIENNTAAVLQSKGFHEMSESALAVLLQSDRLQVDEVDVLAAVRDWATVNSAAMNKTVQQTAEQVVVHVRLPLLSPEELQEIEQQNEKDSLIPVSMFAVAWRSHALQQRDETSALLRRRRGTTHRMFHHGKEGD